MSEKQEKYKVDKKTKPAKKKKEVVGKQQKVNGRPSKYKPEYDKIAFNAARLGHKDKEIAEIFSVTEQTLNNWKHDFNSFFESLQKGKDVADIETAESALMKRVKGYEYQEIYSDLDANGKPIPDKTRVVKKYMGPDTRAIMFYLNNRNAKRWSADPMPQTEGSAKIISDFINALRPDSNERTDDNDSETDN